MNESSETISEALSSFFLILEDWFYKNNNIITQIFYFWPRNITSFSNRFLNIELSWWKHKIKSELFFYSYINWNLCALLREPLKSENKFGIILWICIVGTLVVRVLTSSCNRPDGITASFLKYITLRENESKSNN